MPRRTCSGKKVPSPLTHKAFSATKYSASSVTLLPLGAMLLAGSLGAMAQTATDGGKTLPTVTVTERAEAPEGKDSVRATEVTIGKGKQLLRDVPQSVTVITEKVMDDRNLDTLKEVLAPPAASASRPLKAARKTSSFAAFRCKARATCLWTACATPPFTSATPSTSTASR
jgi:catecholate siderophore receptor